MAVGVLASACAGRSTPTGEAESPPLQASGEPDRAKNAVEPLHEDAPACIEDPFAHAAAVLVDDWSDVISERTEKPVVLSDYPRPGVGCASMSTVADLDGDDKPETEVIESCSWGTQGALHVLYFSNHGCVRFAGALVAGELSPLETTHNGVRDLEATWSNGCAGADYEWTRFAWDGSAYNVAETKTYKTCGNADGIP